MYGITQRELAQQPTGPLFLERLAKAEIRQFSLPPLCPTYVTISITRCQWVPRGAAPVVWHSPSSVARRIPGSTPDA
jgi:hypothetical protein